MIIQLKVDSDWTNFHLSLRYRATLYEMEAFYISDARYSVYRFMYMDP